MEGMEGEVYIDNADDNNEMEVTDPDQGEQGDWEMPDEWRQLAASVLSMISGSGEMFDWSYQEVDILTLRECADLQVRQPVISTGSGSGSDL